MTTTRETTGVKRDSREFWDLNPCGSSESWLRAKELRDSYTDAYLLPHLRGPLFEGRHVLEIGCGQGLDASEIVQRCRDYVGIDMSLASLEVARHEVGQRKPDGTPALFVHADAERLCFAAETFDLIYSVGVLHHTPGFDAAIDEVYRLLEPGGKFVLMLYRSYTPLWCVLRTVRGVLRIPFLGPHLRRRALAGLRRPDRDADSGTALHELVGCPVIDTYTLRDLRRRFAGRFRFVHSECHRVGFEQVTRIVPRRLRRWWPQRMFDGLDQRIGKWCGFYMLTICEKIPRGQMR